MKDLKRLYAFVLSATMLMSCAFLPACQDIIHRSKKNTQVNINQSSDNKPDEAEDTDIKDSLPDNLDFQNRTFTIFVPDDYSQNLLMEGSEEFAGDVVNDTVRTRNSNVESRFNCRLKYIADASVNSGKIAQYINKYLMSADPGVDLFLGHQYSIAPLSAKAKFVNCNEVEYLDFTKPWWNNQIMDALKVDNNDRVFLAGDYFINILQRTATLFFNKTMYGNLYEDAEQLYNEVLDGNWTIDRMSDLSKQTFEDLNNDGVTSLGDQLGYLTWGCASSVDQFAYAAGIEFSKRGSDGEIILSLFDERATVLTEKIVDFFYQEGSFYKHNWSEGTTALGGEMALSAEFAKGKSLFLGIQVLEGAYKLRGMDDDFGFLPYPKLNEEQKNYYSLVADVALLGALNPASKNIDMAGTIIEALSYETYCLVKPAWYEKALKIKYSRDDTSSKIIDLIHDSSYTDFIYVYSPSLNYIGVVFRDLVGKNSKDYMSAVTKKEKSVNAGLKKLIESYKALEG